MELGKTGRWWLRLAAAGLLLTGAAAFIACSDDDDNDTDSTPAATAAATQEVSAEAEAVQQVFLDAIDAWNPQGSDRRCRSRVVHHRSGWLGTCAEHSFHSPLACP